MNRPPRSALIKRQLASKQQRSPASMMPSLKRTERKGSKKSPSTPSPSQVISDLIEATCHEILSLHGDEGTNSIPSVSDFAVLAKRLDYYFEQLSSTSEEPLLVDPNIRTRILLAKLVLDICVRSAYASDEDEDDADAATENLPPLIDMTQEQWKNLYRELGMVTNDQMDSDDSVPLQSLICQAEAFVALAKLRSQLQSAIEEIEEDYRKSPSKKKPAVSFSFINDHVVAYSEKAEEINGKLESIDKNLFIPSKMLSLKRCSTIERVKGSAQSILANIEGLVAKRVFPLNHFQSSLWELLRKLEKDYLPAPKLFQVGYFNNGSSSAATPVPRAKSSKSTTPVSPSAASSNNQRAPTRKNVKRKAAKKVNYADPTDNISGLNKEKVAWNKTTTAAEKEEASEFDFGSAEEEEGEPEVKPVQKKRQKRIPYSEEERQALLEGVKEIGKGKWREIRDAYADIFDVNNRSTVNLKDLYRTLNK